MSDERKLILTVGLPRSGKTTWALRQGCPVVSGDAIREAIFGKLWWPPGEHQVMMTARTMVRALFLVGHNTVIFDSINVTRQARRFWLPTADCLWTIDYMSINTVPSICKERAIASDQAYLIPVIKNAVYKFETPETDNFGDWVKDGWNECDFFDGEIRCVI